MSKCFYGVRSFSVSRTGSSRHQVHLERCHRLYCVRDAGRHDNGFSAFRVWATPSMVICAVPSKIVAIASPGAAWVLMASPASKANRVIPAPGLLGQGQADNLTPFIFHLPLQGKGLRMRHILNQSFHELFLLNHYESVICSSLQPSGATTAWGVWAGTARQSPV